MSEANTFGMLIRQIHNALEKIANSQLKAKDLTLSQMTALVEILKAPTRKLTFKELEKRLSQPLAIIQKEEKFWHWRHICHFSCIRRRKRKLFQKGLCCILPKL